MILDVCKQNCVIGIAQADYEAVKLSLDDLNLFVAFKFQNQCYMNERCERDGLFQLLRLTDVRAIADEPNRNIHERFVGSLQPSICGKCSAEPFRIAVSSVTKPNGSEKTSCW